jgi:hypothetical protein
MLAWLQLLGAMLILIPFVGAQIGRFAVESTAYLVLNLVGASLLAALALEDRQWGFLLLESVWAIVAAHALYQGGRTGLRTSR